MADRMANNFLLRTPRQHAGNAVGSRRPMVRRDLDCPYPGRYSVRAFRSGEGFEGLRILEVGCYAHTTGYKLMRELDADVTLFDISAKAGIS